MYTVSPELEKLTKFVIETKWDDLPNPVVHETKRLILDSIGDALAAITTDPGKMIITLARRLGGPPEASIIGVGERVEIPSVEDIMTWDSAPDLLCEACAGRPLIFPFLDRLADMCNVCGKESEAGAETRIVVARDRKTQTISMLPQHEYSGFRPITLWICRRCLAHLASNTASTILSQIKSFAALLAICSAVMFALLLWSLCDDVGGILLRSTLIVALALFILGLVATLRWWRRSEALLWRAQDVDAAMTSAELENLFASLDGSAGFSAFVLTAIVLCLPTNAVWWPARVFRSYYATFAGEGEWSEGAADALAQSARTVNQ